MYRKRQGTTGIRAHLYETKLLSLLYFRAFRDDRIAEFQLASNVDDLGAFDDICFKANVKGFIKPVLVFIQAKHRENLNQILQIDLTTYFMSYLRIRQHFDKRNNELFFKGTFDETECLFLLYTTTDIKFSEESNKSGFSAILNDLFDTGGTVKQLYKDDETLKNLTKKSIENQLTSLAGQIARIVTGKIHDFQTILQDELVLLYHVILAQKVFEVSEIQPAQSNNDGRRRHRIASFRQEFFDNSEEYIPLFRDTLLEIIIFNKSSFNSSVFHKHPRFTLLYEANKLAAKEMLLSLRFKVPVEFGNKDLTMSGNDAKIERRIDHLSSRIKHIIDNCTISKMVTIDESLEHGCLRLIAGAIGNIFVLDDNTKLMKITDNWKSLGTLAKRLYTKLNSKIHNLHEYKFYIVIDKMPKLSFDFSEYEENLARDFLNKFLCYCNQADEKGVEEILKGEIEDYQLNQQNYFQVETDAMFLKYHAAIQEWWLRPQHSMYLTREKDLFRLSTNNIIIEPLTRSINLTYMNKLQQYNYTFTEDAVRCLNLQDQHSSTVIVAENSVLTVAKVMQHLKYKDHVVLDLEYIANLPTSAHRDALRAELTNTNIKVLILVCDKIDSRDQMKTLEDVAEAVRSKTTIIITNQTTLEVLNNYIPKEHNLLYDKKLSLIDLSKESQEIILETATATFSGIEIRLDLLLGIRGNKGRVHDWP